MDNGHHHPHSCSGGGLFFGSIPTNDICEIRQTLEGRAVSSEKGGKPLSSFLILFYPSSFYTHFLALPAFTVFYEDISAQFDAYNASPPFPFSQLVVLSSSGISSVDSIVVPSLKASLQFLSELQIPSLWVFLLVNTITQCKETRTKRRSRDCCFKKKKKKIPSLTSSLS